MKISPAVAAGMNSSALGRLVADEQCYTVTKGIYMPTSIDYNEENQFKVATLIVGEPSAICLLSALSVYGLTDQIPRQTWVTVPQPKRTRERSLKILRQVDPRWDIGINKKNGYSITSVERTIVDAFFYKRMLGSNVAISALREAVRKKLTTPSKVLDMAKKARCCPQSASLPRGDGMSKILSPTKVQAELNKLAKTTKTHSVNDLRMVLALERIIARVEAHKVLSKHFVFKGGFVLLKMTNSERFIRDVDVLAIGLSRKQVPKLMEEALSENLQDGLWFGDIKSSDLITKGPYGGYSFNAAFTIGNVPTPNDSKIKKFSRINIDIGFDDALEAMPKKQAMTSILSIEEPVTWSVYPLMDSFIKSIQEPRL